jgi:hypothetical protein
MERPLNVRSSSYLLRPLLLILSPFTATLVLARMMSLSSVDTPLRVECCLKYCQIGIFIAYDTPGLVFGKIQIETDWSVWNWSRRCL